ncbi:MAG TPA: histidine kinase, partial [Micromonosporaceae bacterium]
VVVLTVVLSGLAATVAAVDDRVLDALPGLVTVAFAVVGAVILRHRIDNRIGWLLTSGAVPFAVLNAGTAYARHDHGSLPGALAVAAVVNVMPLLGLGVLVAVLPQVFPTGAPVSPRWRPLLWTGWTFTVLGAVSNLFDAEQVQDLPGVQNPAAIGAVQPLVNTAQFVALLCLVVSVASGVAGLVVRWRRSRGDERQQLKWFLAGFVPVLVPIALHDAFPQVAGALIALLLTLVPVTIGVAVLRYRLYDLDVVVNRVLVYTLLSASTAVVYVAAVALAEAVAGWGHGLPVQIGATVLAAALFGPVRLRVQTAVDRLFYGDRARPYDALTRLGRALEHAPEPDATLTGIVESVADALRVPYAAIEFVLADEVVVAAEHGTAESEPVRFPMIYQDETIGHLAVCPRGTGETFSAADGRLLADLARQSGVAAHASRVTAALQQARLALITAREEERRRLRRDLHDGLGPALAGVTLGLHAAQATIPIDAGRAVALLADIETQVEDAVRDIRRLVYGLRPPAIDEYGLLRAIQQYASQLSVVAAVQAPEVGLGDLPAAVEVAAYRIATEAMT